MTIGFFEEDPGVRSMGRMIAFVLLLVAVFVIVWQVVHGTVDRLFIAELLAAAIGSKHVGRWLEDRPA